MPSNKDLSKFDLSPENLALPDYIETQSLINLGGMGAIYDARHKNNGNRLAVKVLRPEHLHDEVARKRFMKEAKAVGALRHNNIVHLLDYGVSSKEIPYMVMEYLDGTDLWHRVNDQGKLPVKEVLDIFIQASRGFGHAHENGIIHRDLKPSNIMVIESGDADSREVKIVDFGIAKFYRDDAASKEQDTPLTIAGETVGTPLFMSPEQCLSSKVDNRSDIYALGLVMFLCLTGKLPVEGASAVEVFGKHVGGQVDLSVVPPVMQVVLRRCLEKDPIDRYQTMGELEQDLLRVQKEESPMFKLSGKQKRSVKGMVTFVVAIILGFGIGFAILSALGMFSS